MPKLYEYLGIVLFFYSNEHEPIHVHGKYNGKETKGKVWNRRKGEILKSL
ncbi:DUF4160 domain-containing protein [Aliikangiella maris]|uniref:DUF4160 domain-containing protein n=2 Tax=Aliikangiella maris TaxID=3162458 RepID=A0ABV2C061_9GAMM